MSRRLVSRSYRWRVHIGVVVTTSLLVAGNVSAVVVNRGGSTLPAGPVIEHIGGVVVPTVTPAPPGPTTPGELHLVLWADTVKAGQIVIATVHGPDLSTYICGVYDTLEARISVLWRTTHYLTIAEYIPANVSSPGFPKVPIDYPVNANAAFFAIGLPIRPYRIRIPDLPTGSYRVRQDIDQGAKVPPVKGSLFTPPFTSGRERLSKRMQPSISAVPTGRKHRGTSCGSATGGLEAPAATPQQVFGTDSTRR